MKAQTNKAHRLAVNEVRLVGGNRAVEFSPTFSVWSFALLRVRGADLSR